MLNNPETLSRLNAACCRLVKSLSSTCFVSFDDVLPRLLHSHGVSTLAHLGVTSLPCLDSLWLIDQQVRL